MQDPAELGAHDPVVARWARVRALGVSPEAAHEPAVLNAGQLAERRERVASVMRAAQPLLARAAGAFSARDYTLLLADAEGVIIDRFDGGGFEPTAKRNRLIAGALWNETVRGTNAIGTAVAERAPVSVHGCAHWERRNHPLSCYASPIMDPYGGMAAVVDVTTMSSAAADFAELALLTLAQGIESQLYMQAYAAHVPSTRQEALRRIEAPAFVMQRGGLVPQANAAGQAWLRQRSCNRDLFANLWAAVDTGHGGVHFYGQQFRLEPMAFGQGPALGVLVVVEPLGPSRLGPVPPGPFEHMAGDDARLQETKTRALKFARTELPCLLLAETGTGKELLARGIHKASGRAQGPFVALNCGALSEALLESELFGYAPGAYTGANPDGASGKLEAAAGGTLFLDEVAEMPARLQAMLLRVLEDGSFHRIGEVQARQANFRLVCATCRDLPALVQAGSFRQDLYYRVRGACLALPPLRERTDRMMLARALLVAIAGEAAPPISAEAEAEILRHDWPGNVRELKSALAHAYALQPQRIEADNLPAVRATPLARTPVDAPSAPGASLAECELHALEAALQAHPGNLSAAARHLGVARTTLYRMMKKRGLR